MERSLHTLCVYCIFASTVKFLAYFDVCVVFTLICWIARQNLDAPITLALECVRGPLPRWRTHDLPLRVLRL
jgi:hypothetical protein